MKYFVCLFFWAYNIALFSQEPAKDCRVKDADMQPIIQRFNPFFSDHQWLNMMKQETARMDKYRLLMIGQEGCLRHHNHFSLFVAREVLVKSDSFWIAEAVNMFRAVYYGQKEYRSFQKEFEETFAEKFLTYGVNKEFNFPVGTRNFLCEIEVPADKTKDASVRIDMVEFVFEEKVVEARGNNAKDDGWKEGKKE